MMAENPVCSECGAALDRASKGGLCLACLRKLDPAGSDEGATTRPISASLDLPADNTPALGEQIRYFGDYELLSEIARGGMGIVFKARQISLDRLVAVKMILSGRLASAGDVQRFQGEARAAASLAHPNIVAIHEVGQHHGQHYFSMDYIAGTSLAEQLRAGPPAPQQAAQLVQAMANAIEYAHQRGILHRDLKPSNILLDEHGNVHITDFGLAKWTTKASELTVTGQVLGTPNYMSPEQALGRWSDLGPATDVYGLGAILYELITGQPPFRAETAAAVLREVVEAEPAAPTQLAPHVPLDLETICLKCLEKQPLQRYPSAGALGAELGRFLAGDPIQARPPGGVRKIWTWCKTHPWFIARAAAMLIVVLLGLVYWLWAERQRLAWSIAHPGETTRWQANTVATTLATRFLWAPLIVWALYHLRRFGPLNVARGDPPSTLWYGLLIGSGFAGLLATTVLVAQGIDALVWNQKPATSLGSMLIYLLIILQLQLQILIEGIRGYEARLTLSRIAQEKSILSPEGFEFRPKTFWTIVSSEIVCAGVAVVSLDSGQRGDVLAAVFVGWICGVAFAALPMISNRTSRAAAGFFILMLFIYLVSVALSTVSETSAARRTLLGVILLSLCAGLLIRCAWQRKPARFAGS